jgi:hypothetical protein
MTGLLPELLWLTSGRHSLYIDGSISLVDVYLDGIRSLVKKS